MPTRPDGQNPCQDCNLANPQPTATPEPQSFIAAARAGELQLIDALPPVPADGWILAGGSAAALGAFADKPIPPLLHDLHHLACQLTL